MTERRSTAETLVASDPRIGGGGSSTVTSTLPSSQAFIGQVMDGRYYIEELLGEGGMGVVYKARHAVIDKRVAVKVLRPDFVSDEEMLLRFLNEARAASRIGSPHIVDISDFGRSPEGAAYFVMEFLEGRSLAHVLGASGALPVGRLVHIAKQIAQGLDSAHAHGIIHRDLKPENVMLVPRGGDPDFVKIFDFGIAKVGGETARFTQTGAVFGTPHYMSPEQAAGLTVDPRTDVYALGVILFEMATGNVPFEADSFMAILTQHLYKPPPSIRAAGLADIPESLEAVIQKCLSKKPSLRYASMGELVLDLERLERGYAPVAEVNQAARAAADAPVDYFGGGPAADLVDSARTVAPGRTSRGPLTGVFIGIFLLFAVVGGVALASAMWSRANARTVAARSAGLSAPDPSAEPSASASAVLQATPSVARGGMPVTRSVQVSATPADATIWQGSTSLGVQPRTVSVSAGEKVTVRVERAGYKVEQRTLDGTESDVSVKLQPDPRARKLATASTTVAPAKPSPPRCRKDEILVFDKCEKNPRATE